MELYELNNLLHKVKIDNDFIELESEHDSASVHFVKGSFLFILNAKGLFSNKCLRTFRNKLINKIQERNLKII